MARREQAIRRLQIFGAHCSGTNWVDSLIQTNFHGLKVMPTDVVGGNDNFGWKHGDLGRETVTYIDGREVRHVGERIIWTRKGINISDSDPRYTGVDHDGDLYIKNHALPLNQNNSSDTLIVVVNRNPMSWMQSFHKTPHHALEIYGTNFGAYIRKQPFRQYESVYLGAINNDTTEGQAARKNWIRKGIILENDQSVFDHRKKSLDTFETFAQRVQNVAFVPYERVLADPQGALAEIAGVYGIQMSSDFTDVRAYKTKGNQQFTGSKYTPVTAYDLDYITAHIAAASEKTAGFTLDTSGKYSQENFQNPASLVYVNQKIRYYRAGKLVVPRV